MRALKELIYFIHAAAILLLIALVASLMPGDKVNTPVGATLLSIVVIGFLDALLTAPLYAITRRWGRT